MVLVLKPLNFALKDDDTGHAILVYESYYTLYNALNISVFFQVVLLIYFMIREKENQISYDDPYDRKLFG